MHHVSEIESSVPNYDSNGLAVELCGAQTIKLSPYSLIIETIPVVWREALANT